MNKAEALLFNTEYQPVDYVAACAALKMDPGHPRMTGLKVSYTLKDWEDQDEQGKDGKDNPVIIPPVPEAPPRPKPKLLIVLPDLMYQ
jgi:hypothetical protein